jgi:histo-blood group ABO system transferase
MGKDKKQKNIALLIIATGKYINFVNQCCKSIDKYFLPGYNKHIFLFTDSKRSFRKNITKMFIKRKGFPGDTLYRYHYFLMLEGTLNRFDYIYYLDVDMKVVNYVREEIFGNLVATIHPGFNGGRGTPETNPASTAYIAENEPLTYFCGGFNGGTVTEFLRMAKTIKRNIDKDDSNNIVAIWHDESHLNRYLINTPPAIVLDPSYCYPEGHEHLPHLLHIKPKIIALFKNHDEIRSDKALPIIFLKRLITKIKNSYKKYIRIYRHPTL